MSMDIYNASVELRGILGEATASHWSDRTVLDCLNRAQLRVGMELSQTIGDWFLTKEDVTMTNGLITLPSNCSKPAFLFKADTKLIIPISMKPQEQGSRFYPATYEHLNQGTYEAFLYGDYIQVNTDQLSGTYELWYEKRIKKLLHGTAYVGGANYLILDRTLPRSYEESYYVGESILIYDGTGATVVESISTSTIAGLISITGTFDETSKYSMISPLPDAAYDYWLNQAAMTAFSKPSSVVDKEAIRWIREDLKESKELFNDWCSKRIKDNIYMMRK